MLPSHHDARQAIVFPKSAAAFRTALADIQRQLKERAGGSDAKAEAEAVALASELCLDLGSYLSVWVLDTLVAAGELTRADVSAAASGFANIVRAHGSPEQIKGMEDERASIAASETRKMCGAARAGHLGTFWGHDYCTGMDHSLRRGARFVTSNPAKINLFRKENPETWTGLLEAAKRENPGAATERLISAMFVKVTAINARALKPIHEATGGLDGFVCVQTNPKNINDSAKMTAEVLYWEEAYKRELGYEPINVVYKLPAVKAAVPTVKELVARGIRVCMTLNFTVSQHEIFADLIQQGKKNGFVVLMSGFLDDNVAAELGSLGIDNPKQYAKWAGVAVMRKSYANLRARGMDKAAIMAAAIRGPYTIACCLTDCPESPVYFTTMTEKIKEFDAEPRKFVSEMNDPVPAETMAMLAKSRIFNQAYNREQLDLDTVSDFIPLQAVLKVFTDAYMEIEKSLAPS